VAFPDLAGCLFGVGQQARRGLVQGRALVERLVRQAIADGYIDSEAQDALAAIDVHLDRLFRSP